MLKTIAKRRSIRKYTAEEVPQELIEKVLQAGMLAPSSKNSQPWKFIVVRGKAKEEMAKVMRRGMDRERQTPLMPESLRYMEGAEYTLRIMQQAPTVIFVMNVQAVKLGQQMTADERISEICNAQSIGAAIENMTLAATELGLGSLWICDTFLHKRNCVNGSARTANCMPRWRWDMRRRRPARDRERKWRMS